MYLYNYRLLGIWIRWDEFRLDKCSRLSSAVHRTNPAPGEAGEHGPEMFCENSRTEPPSPTEWQRGDLAGDMGGL
jgi:hypothetical protein